MFLNYLLKVKVKVTQTRTCLKTSYFLIFNVMYSQFVGILSLFLVAINIIKCSLNTNIFYRIMPPRLRSRAFKLNRFGHFMKIWERLFKYLLGFYISVFTLCPPVNFLAYMTN